MRFETITLNVERNVTMTAYLLDVNGEFGNIPKRPAILVLPGGGYRMCSAREADPVALLYLQAGFHAFVLNYSVGKEAIWPNPLHDYEQAMDMIRDKADDWSLYSDKIAVIGFSAGGHLAASAATIGKNKPDAAILGYAVTEEQTAQACLESAPDLVSRVDGNTCPCFVFTTRTDNVVPVSNSIRFIQALSENGIMFESHIYAYGPHGFSTGNSAVLMPGADICNRAGRWTEDSIEWLKDIWGDFGQGSFTEPSCIRRMNGDRDKFLSVDCTLGHLMANVKSRAILEPMMAETQKKLVEEYGSEMNHEQDLKTEQSSLLDNMTLKDLLLAGKVPENVIEQLNQQLNQIPNI